MARFFWRHRQGCVATECDATHARANPEACERIGSISRAHIAFYIVHSLSSIYITSLPSWLSIRNSTNSAGILLLHPTMAHPQNHPPPNAFFYGEQGTSIHIHDGNFMQNNFLQAQHRCSDADGTIMTRSCSSGDTGTNCVNASFQTDSDIYRLMYPRQLSTLQTRSTRQNVTQTPARPYRRISWIGYCRL